MKGFDPLCTKGCLEATCQERVKNGPDGDDLNVAEDWDWAAGRMGRVHRVLAHFMDLGGYVGGGDEGSEPLSTASSGLLLSFGSPLAGNQAACWRGYSSRAD